MNTIYIASFDIGKKNFAFTIEKINLSLLNNIKNIPKDLRYDKNNIATPEFNQILDDLYKVGEVILVENLDLTYDCQKSKYLDPKIYINMYDKLEEYREYWDKCDVFIIEQQMSFGKNKYNTMALKLGQHCYSYFISYYRDSKQIIEYPAYLKTQTLGAPKKLTKPQRKKWAVEKLDYISNLRQCNKLLNIKTKKKKDDMADCLLMNISYCYLYHVDQQ